jgi:CRISPR-associated protein Cas2
MVLVISYDVREDKRRTKVAKCLLGYGTRVQYSVFECRLKPAQVSKVLEELRRLIDVTTDSVRCYPLDAGAVKCMQVVGVGKVCTDHPGYYLC